jgi:hypothetical protein
MKLAKKNSNRERIKLDIQLANELMRELINILNKNNLQFESAKKSNKNNNENSKSHILKEKFVPNTPNNSMYSSICKIQLTI